MSTHHFYHSKFLLKLFTWDLYATTYEGVQTYPFSTIFFFVEMTNQNCLSELSKKSILFRFRLSLITLPSKEIVRVRLPRFYTVYAF